MLTLAKMAGNKGRHDKNKMTIFTKIALRHFRGRLKGGPGKTVKNKNEMVKGVKNDQSNHFV